MNKMIMIYNLPIIKCNYDVCEYIWKIVNQDASFVIANKWFARINQKMELFMTLINTRQCIQYNNVIYTYHDPTDAIVLNTFNKINNILSGKEMDKLSWIKCGINLLKGIRLFYPDYNNIIYYMHIDI